MNIDINILSFQCLLFNSVILNAEHKDKEEIQLFISACIFISFLLIYNQFYYSHPIQIILRVIPSISIMTILICTTFYTEK